MIIYGETILLMITLPINPPRHFFHSHPATLQGARWSRGRNSGGSSFIPTTRMV